MHPQIINEFIELVKIPVASRNERAIADAVIPKLKELGFSVSEDKAGEALGGNAGNIVAKLEGEAGVPWVLLSAHLDRVKNPGVITPVINESEGTISSDGTTILAADCVAGICVILDGIRRLLAENAPHGGIEIVFSVCEEVGVCGTKHLDYSTLQSKISYVLDCSGKMGKIMVQAPTKYTIKVGVHGKSAHAGNEPEKGINAIKVAAIALANLTEGRISPAVTSNFGCIQGGSSTNVVCDHVEIVGEARGTNDVELERYIDHVKEVFANTAKDMGTTIDVEIVPLYYTFKVEESDAVVTMAAQAMRNLGIEPFCTPGGGGMDGNRFNREGIKAVGLTPGYMKAHTNNETLNMADFIKCGELVTELVKEVHRSAASSNKAV